MEEYFPTDDKASKNGTEDEASKNGAEDKASKNGTGEKAMSEYETLRLRNIEHNNACLRELGLLSNREEGEEAENNHTTTETARDSNVQTLHGHSSSFVPTSDDSSSSDTETDSERSSSSNIIGEVGDKQTCPKDHSILKGFQGGKLCLMLCARSAGQKFGTAVSMECIRGFHNNPKDTKQITPNADCPLRYCENFKTICNAILCHDSKKLLTQGRGKRTRC
jgi:hypothetical protein